MNCTRCNKNERYTSRRICLDCINADNREKRAIAGRGKPPSKLDAEAVAKCIALYEDGKTLEAIGQATGTSRTTVAKALRKAGVKLKEKGQGVFQNIEAEKEFYRGFNPLMAKMASVSLRVSA